MFSTIPEHICKNRPLAKRLKVVIENLKVTFNPLKIILFGSYSRGDFSKDSTIDIFVIADTKKRFVERIRAAIEVTGGNPPVEPLVYTQEEFDLLLHQGEGFLNSALDESVVLYERKGDEETFFL